jgi:hypothetical protein
MVSDDRISSHALVGGDAKVRVIPDGASWRVAEVRTALRKDN